MGDLDGIILEVHLEVTSIVEDSEGLLAIGVYLKESVSIKTELLNQLSGDWLRL